MVTKITLEEAFKLKDKLFIDTRSPKEYTNDHILGAISLPILDNQERHEVGLIYKQISQELAIEKGIEYYTKKIPNIIKTIKQYQDKTLIIYCARGGMRSGIITTLLESLELKVYQLKGGYKEFRNYLLKKLNNFTLKPKVFVLHGLTCTGKTELLKKIPNFLDLEGIAQHRGSLYGAIGLIPNSQKKFENLLLARVTELNEQPYLIMEGESRRVGDCIMPPFLWSARENGQNILIERTNKLRFKTVIKEYFLNPKIMEEIKVISQKLSKNLSKKNKEDLLNYLENKNYEKAAEILLLKYYDPLYEHTLNKKKYVLTVNNDNLAKAVTEIKSYLKSTVPS